MVRSLVRLLVAPKLFRALQIGRFGSFVCASFLGSAKARISSKVAVVPSFARAALTMSLQLSAGAVAGGCSAEEELGCSGTMTV